MKRSEMIDRLDSLLYTQSDLDDVSSKLMSKVILDFVEKLGMEPPSYIANDQSGQYGVTSYYVNEWEPEDDEK